MIEAVRLQLAEMGKTCCIVEELQAQEKGRGVKLSPSSSSEAIKIRVDGCLIDDGAKRCDCLFFYKKSEGRRYAFLVELKGNNYFHALEQLAATKRHENYKALLSAVQPSKVKAIAVAIVSEKANINRPRKDEWEDDHKLRLRAIPMKDDKTFDLKELTKNK